VYVPLRDDERLALWLLAQREERHFRIVAARLLREALIAAGTLTPEPAP
jgi:hypothetical protein